MATIESWWSIVLEAAYRYFSELANNSCNDLSSNLYKHDPYFPKLRNFAQWIACNYDENVDIRYGLNMIYMYNAKQYLQLYTKYKLKEMHLEFCVMLLSCRFPSFIYIYICLIWFFYAIDAIIYGNCFFKGYNRKRRHRFGLVVPVLHYLGYSKGEQSTDTKASHCALPRQIQS